ncbi:hypothetical protein [Sphingopyxis sp.]|uniref:hypothetical protein n=1 Tax=Sphingopyxis sp. TaxID=1908224 RepID=UPI003D0A2362
MLWAVIGIMLVAVLIVKLSGGAIPGITRGDPARRDPPRDGGDSSYGDSTYSASPMMMTSESGGVPTCDVGDSGWSSGSDGDCGGGGDGGGDGGGGGGGD